MKTRKYILNVLMTFAIFLLSSGDSWAIILEKTSTGFYYPTGTTSLGDYAGWLSSGCNGNTGYFEDEYHLGKDIKASLNDDVYPISYGQVLYKSYNGWGAGNVAVLILHRLSNGETFIALYGHIASSSVADLNIGDYVLPGKSIGNIGYWPYGVHLHFTVWSNRSSIPPSPYGRTSCSNWPSTYGQVNPIEWIESQTPIRGNLVNIEGQSEVYWLQNGKAYHVPNAATIQSMSSIPGWDEVWTISPDVLEIVQPSNAPTEEGIFEEGQKFINTNYQSDGLQIRLFNTSQIYLAHKGQKRSISENVFNQLGYESNEINDVIEVTQTILDLFSLGNPITISSPISLMNGNGDASVHIIVDPYGTYGTATNAGAAMYDPIGSQNSASTIYQSSLYFSPLDFFLNGGGIPGGSLNDGIFTSVAVMEAKSAFSVQDFNFELTQTLNTKSPQGSTLVQTYKITNTGVATSLELIRHVDGDLFFDGTLIDSGGASSDGLTIFEFDSGDDRTNPSTFVGITNQGGDDLGYNIGYRIAPYRFTDDIISYGGGVLDDSIYNDNDGDNIIDNPYDVTLSLGNSFLINPNQTVTFVTKTIFGSGSLIAKSALPTGVSLVQENYNTINQNETHQQSFTNSNVQDIWVVLAFGSEFNFKIYQPDGVLYQEEQSTISPITTFIPNAQIGEWQFEITAIEVPIQNDPYVVVVGISDIDSDGIFDAQDNCPSIANFNQIDFDSDDLGNVCDDDDDNDGYSDEEEITAGSDPLDPNSTPLIPGDLDHDGDIDRNDINIITSYRNQPASACPDCDLDRDGTITVGDARQAVLLCTRPRCATQ